MAAPVRTRWAAIGAAVAITLGAGTIRVVDATIDSGEKPVLVQIPTCRITDTRSAAVDARSTPLGPGEIYVLTAHGTTGECTIPTDATAVQLNVTALSATLPTFFTIWGPGPQPNTSALNPAPGQPPTPNAVTVELDDNGQFRIFNSTGNVNTFVDVTGYFDDHNHDDRYDTSAEVDAKIAANPGPQGPKGDTGDQGLQGPPGADGSSLFVRTVVVGPVGTAQENGVALENAIAGITGATADDPWTVLVEPGTYAVGIIEPTLPDHVSLRGWGQNHTKITGNGNGGVVDPGENSTISDVWLENTSIGGREALVVDETGVVVRNVKMTGPNGADGLTLQTGVGPIVIDNATIDVPGDGVFLPAGSVLRNSHVTSTGGNALVLNNAPDVEVTNTTLVSTTGFGVRINGVNELTKTTFDGVRIEASDDAIDLIEGELTIRHSTLLSTTGASVRSDEDGPDSILFVYQSHVEVAVGHLTAFTAGSSTCRQVSSATASGSSCTVI